MFLVYSQHSLTVIIGDMSSSSVDNNRLIAYAMYRLGGNIGLLRFRFMTQSNALGESLMIVVTCSRYLSGILMVENSDSRLSCPTSVMPFLIIRCTWSSARCSPSGYPKVSIRPRKLRESGSDLSCLPTLSIQIVKTSLCSGGMCSILSLSRAIYSSLSRHLQKSVRTLFITLSWTCLKKFL